MARILQIVGSYTTPDMAELSELYARGCEAALAAEFGIASLHRSPDGAWRLVERLAELPHAPPLSLDAAIGAVRAQDFDIGLPQMFCRPGMTRGRDLFATLGVPMVGNPSPVMDIATDKARTRDVVAAAGVRVPDARRVAAAVADSVDPASLPTLPVVVKPVAADNSDGVSLVRNGVELAPALQRATAFGDVLVERFVPPGRELRCGVVAWNGTLRALPPEAYPVSAAHPVRTRDDKLARDPHGDLRLVAKTRDAAWIVEPDDPSTDALQAAAIRAFHALGCRHYGLFDFRVDADGIPWFLEAGLYCSFSPDSVLVAMARAGGIGLADLLRGLATEPEFAPAAQTATHAA